MFWHFIVLVLSTAVLVLVLDRTLRDALRPLNQPSQHRHIAFQVGFAAPIGFTIDRIADGKYVMNRSTLQCRSTGKLKKAILVAEKRFVHGKPFEYEYEYRFTEYEYEKPGILEARTPGITESPGECHHSS